MSKALIAMSGGVDSTLAAKLTQDMGHQCVGCTIRFFDKKILPPPASGEAPAAETAGADDTADARAAADKLGIPFHVLDYTEEFADKILNYFVRSYENAATPNPCIECNRHLKFGKLMEDMKDLGCDYVVTGHYARIEKEGDKYYLKKAMDENKDQSYFLHSLTQERLAHVLFPLGSMHKSEVREAADSFGFRNAHKSDSQDICFIKDGDYARFICHYAGKTYPGGDFVDAEGKVLGKHKGIIHYTIGQR
ncbi:MAG: tRNA 2-thiouridine(34) synthase MnmA, partial [Clostridiales bacterium]|nr:tRNA 2-thiouridine(34) synthase MnmA [Candidatus Blautia equi]